ncbi:MAG: rhomboid family intramembrane serine protease [Roseiflexaceae bacterium]|nr:rhomboid family intramembrane serine protease [Roseiflexaceae bacterium]
MLQMRIPTHRDIAWKVLLGLIVVVYGLEVLLSGSFNPTVEVLFLLGAKWNESIYRDGEYWRLLTPMFLHGSVLHILFNGYSLFSLGPMVERFFGSARFLGLYFISGLAGSIASYAFSPSLSVGASGAIFGLVGGLAVFFYVSRKTFGEMARQQLGSLVTVMMLNLFIGFTPGGNIDNFAHIGGLLGGALLGWLLAPRFTVDDRLYPPELARSYLPFGWPGALAVLAALAALVLFVIVPPV